MITTRIDPALVRARPPAAAPVAKQELTDLAPGLLACLAEEYRDLCVMFCKSPEKNAVYRQVMKVLGE